jgi:hypothetical protein
MKHVVNLVGMMVITSLFCLLAVLAETRLLYETVSGVSENAGTLDDWMQNFTNWALAGIGAALFAGLLWYALGEWIFHVERPGDSNRRPIWIALIAVPLAAWVFAIVLLDTPGQGAWVAYLLLFLNTILCYYFATALFSPSGFKYTPIGATTLRSLRERAA